MGREKGRGKTLCPAVSLLGCELFGFAFVPHHFQGTLGFLDTRVLLAELEFVDNFLGQEFAVADILDLDPAHHLARDHFEVLVVDVDALQTVDFPAR